MNLFVVPTIGFNLLYAFVIIRLDRRDLVWINVTTNPTAGSIAHQITEAYPWDEAPRYLIRDRDRIYGAIVTRRLRAMGIRDKPTASASPWQKWRCRTADRSIRRECVDQIIVLGEAPRCRTVSSAALSTACALPFRQPGREAAAVAFAAMPCRCDLAITSDHDHGIQPL
jgi:hypothetical protein